ncbi:MAG TPA: transporter [Hyphomonadaceae bacterium]|nr:transporter [Hyphomonadaceae bacterium]
MTRHVRLRRNPLQRMLSGRLLAGLAASALLAGLAAGTAQAQGHESHRQGNVGSLISDLYGGDGISLAAGSANPAFSHVAHFTQDSADRLADLNRVLSANIGAYSFNSAVSGVTFDFAEGQAVRSSLSLGPIIGERAPTIGKGRVNVSTSYTHIDYSQLDGRDLTDLTIDLSHQDIPTIDQPFEHDEIELHLRLKLKQDILTFATTYGVTERLDVGVLIPIIDIRGSVSSEAHIIDNGGAGIHQFDPAGESPFDSNSASATGVGDILVRAKWRAFDRVGGTPFDAALVGQIALPTGDKNDLLGTGSTSAYIGGAFSGEFGKITPHLNVGYEYFADEDRTAGIERSNVRMLLGADINATKNFSIASDIIARWEKDDDKFYDLALGAKWAPTDTMDFSFNTIMPLNRNQGLRADVIFSLGFETAF